MMHETPTNAGPRPDVTERFGFGFLAKCCVFRQPGAASEAS